MSHDEVIWYNLIKFECSRNFGNQMPAKDIYHETVKTALIKDGWTITSDPFIIQFKGIRLYADMEAEKALEAEKEGQKIVVEVKVFNTPSPITELEKALGQYSIYRTFLKQSLLKQELYLAIAQDVYQDFFQQPAIEAITSDHQIRLLVFDPKAEEVVVWIK